MQINRKNVPQYIYTIFKLDANNNITSEDSSWTLRYEARMRRRELANQGERVRLYRSVVTLNMPLCYS